MENNPIDRRQMLKQTLATGVVAASAMSLPTISLAQERPAAKFKMDLCGGRVGIDAGQDQLIELASANGFSAVEPLHGHLSKLSESELAELKSNLSDSNLVWSAAGLTVEFRKDDAKFQEGIKALPAIAKALKAAGVDRIGTWLMPCHETLTYVSNFKQHASRLREIAGVLGDHGHRLGLEYVGTKTLWTSKRFPFLHTMAETKELLAQIDQPNAGFILDTWHWTMAEESADDIRTLANEQVVACDLNDAPQEVPLGEQIDSQRELPMATGVIDTQGFMQALIDIGYDGPIRAEPFNKPLNEMENGPAAAATAKAMKAAFATVGA